ncbi:response regulator transcription factor [Candidatus Bipolaricaulota bacterium]|nr:response regulator transcription factor [Candidatus Bipolaricaulota bacterium]
MNKRILVVDDEEWVRELVGRYLEEAGFDVVTAADGRKALTQFDSHRPDLVILDWMLPGLDGLEVATRIRKESSVPIIMLTARTDEGDRIKGLEFGADDYVVKPFSSRELEARVRAVLRRSQGNSAKAALLESGEIRVEIDQHEVQVGSHSVDLSSMEFDLLVFLMEHPGRVFTRLELLEALRGTTYESFERSIDSHIKRLRQKIEPDPKNPRYVLTVFGVGYKFAKDGEEI